MGLPPALRGASALHPALPEAVPTKPPSIGEPQASGPEGSNDNVDRAFFIVTGPLGTGAPHSARRRLGGRRDRMPSSLSVETMRIVSGSMSCTMLLLGEQRFEASVARNRVPISSDRALLSLTVCASRSRGAAHHLSDARSWRTYSHRNPCSCAFACFFVRLSRESKGRISSPSFCRVLASQRPR